ncbi:MAG TPA: TetR/AcrR family transcriptional regulator [Actinomycetota bacterium]|nr:TetR/AcrR family transcriptional regulator [Actinomycetota bacterium]
MAIAPPISRRDQLVEVAARLFSEHGYHGTSMQQLADGLGMLRGSLYAHIDSKEDLLFEIVDRGADRFLGRLDEIVRSAGPTQEKLRSAVLAHVEIVGEQIEAATVFLNEWKFLSQPRRRSVERKREQYASMMRSIIDEGIVVGTFAKDLDARFATLHMLSTLNWLYQWYDPKGELTPMQVAEGFTSMLLNGFTGSYKKGRGA